MPNSPKTAASVGVSHTTRDALKSLAISVSVRVQERVPLSTLVTALAILGERNSTDVEDIVRSLIHSDSTTEGIQSS
jgi:hypothetical protein